MALRHYRRYWLRLVVINRRKVRGDSERCRDKLAIGPRLAVNDQRNAARIITCNVKNPAAGLVRAQLSRPIR